MVKWNANSLYFRRKLWERLAYKLKIAHFISRSDTIGGSQRHVLDISSHLKKEGHSVTVISGPHGAFTDLLIDHGIGVYSIDSLSSEPSFFGFVDDFKTGIALCRIIKENNIELIACHSSKSGLIGRVCAKIMGIKSVYTLHGVQFAPGVATVKRMYVWLFEILARPFSQHVIAVSYCDARLALRSHIISKKRLSVIPNSVNDRGSVNSNRKFLLPLKIVVPARLDKQKDHRTLLKALSKLKHKDWMVDLLGDGPYDQNLKAFVDELGISDKVNFAGLVPNVIPFMEQSDLVMLITHYEGLPIAILEAISLGIPVIASDVGGVSEAVIDGENGFLVERKDVEGIMESLNTLFENPEILKKMSLSSRQHYLDNYSFGKFAADTTSLYRSLVS